jgi:hypothetical protein
MGQMADCGPHLQHNWQSPQVNDQCGHAIAAPKAALISLGQQDPHFCKALLLGCGQALLYADVMV